METRGKKSDRRSMRSKQLILNAFQSLIMEKDSKAITVTDLIERANIGRTTFYAHFEDLDDLQRFIFSRLLHQIEQEIEDHVEALEVPKDATQNLIPSYALFKIAAEKHGIFKKHAEAAEYGLRRLIEPLSIRFEKKLDEIGVSEPKGDISRQMLATFLFSGLIAILIDWVYADMPETAEAMDIKFQQLAQPTLKRLIP